MSKEIEEIKESLKEQWRAIQWRAIHTGGCKVISIGDKCQCHLCLIDKMFSLLEVRDNVIKTLEDEIAELRTSLEIETENNFCWVKELERAKRDFEIEKSISIASIENCKKAESLLEKEKVDRGILEDEFLRVSHALEKEKEQSDYFRLEVNRLTDELAKKEEKMTLREFLTKVLERNRKMEAKAKEEGYYASALKREGAIDEVGVILLELSTSILLDKEI